ARESLKTDVVTGHVPPVEYSANEKDKWPESIKEFRESAESEGFALSGADGDRLDYLVRHGDDVWVYSRSLGNVRMQAIAQQYRRAREIVADSRQRDLKRGLTVTLVILVVAIWVVALVSLVYLAHRISSPIQRLTGGLSELASGNLRVRL